MKTNVGINLENNPIIVNFYEWSNTYEAMKSESESRNTISDLTFVSVHLNTSRNLCLSLYFFTFTLEARTGFLSPLLFVGLISSSCPGL